MAVPKQKMGRARTHSRRGEAKLPHRVCPNCGFYKSREVIVTE